ncbi:DUF6541 family protein [Clostridium chrysemydis]|uniref:DUF6541 family protein n=1 Tax=Clostridium chrysemydis TaxID=2665504 RepID=UPI0018847A32|nr:DUF6541 family protein [Clostridium chrysemydis]
MEQKKNSKEGLIILVLIILTTITVIPLFITPIIRGDDIFFHLLRIEDIKNGILGGQFPVQIMPESLYGFGYANGIFYPDLFLYFPALLRIMGVDLRIAYGIFMSLCTFLATFSMYFCVKKIFKNINIAFFSSVIYIFAQYKITDLYFRSAVAEYISFIFIPIIILGVYELLYRDYKKYYILAIGMSAVVLTHLLSVMMIASMCVCFYLFSILKIIKEPKRLGYSMRAAVLTILLTAYSWIPIIGQFLHGKFNLENVKPFAYEDIVSLNDIFTVNRNSRFFVGIVFVLLVLLYIGAILKKRNNGFVFIIFLIGLGSLLLTIENPIAKEVFQNIKILNNVQFAWRFGLIATPLLGIVSGYSIGVLIPDRTRAKTLVLVLLVITLGGNLLLYTKYYKRKNIDFDNFTSKYSDYIGAGAEYLPKGASEDDIAKKGNKVISKDNTFRYSNYKKKGVKISFDFKTENDNTIVDLPLLYYYGYDYKIIPKEGKTIKGKVEHSEDLCVRVDLGKVKSGTLIVDYKGTFYMTLGNFITLATIIYIIYSRTRNKRNSKVSFKRNSRIYK